MYWPVIKVAVKNKIPEIPGYVLEPLAYMHGAVDPDSGHLSCHYYSLGIASIAIGDTIYPALVIGGCMYLVPGRIKDLDSDPEVHVESVERESARIGGVAIESFMLSLLYNLAREGQASIRFYKIELSDDTASGYAIAAVVSIQQDRDYTVILSKCKEAKYRDEDSMYY